MATELNDVLLHALPDLALLVRRDGVIAAKCGGGDIEVTREHGALEGSSLRDVWPGDIAEHLLSLVRKALKGRACVVGRYRHKGCTYDVRAQPVGIDRAMLLVRAPWNAAASAAPSAVCDADGRLSLESRESFAQKLTEAVESSRLSEAPFALMALHIGGLTEIENALGAGTAERVLAVAMERLSTARRILGSAPAALPQLARLDTDLLAVVLKDAAHRSAVTASAEHARRSLAESISLDSRTLLLSPIVAVAFFPSDGGSAAELLNALSGAIESAQGLRRQNTVVYVSAETAFDSLYVADLEREIHSALEHQELVLHYQPIVELTGHQRTLALDATITWMQPMRGPVSSEHFLPLMQITSLGRRLDDWLLEQACRDLARLTDSGYLRPRIAFSPPPQLLRSGDLAEKIARAAHAAGCEARRLELYVPESLLASGAGRQQVAEVRNLGVRVFADGFGKGGLSLGDLELTPLDGVRIDRSFIDRLASDKRAQAVCRSAVALTRSFDMQCVAVGVESTAQLDQLREIGCALAQGPLFCAPRPLHRFFDEDGTSST
jgi:predicted signal transduction protein with EAL and GGDEF domain